MAKKSVTEVIENLISSFVEEHQMELVDVEFVKEGPHRYLRVFIDKDDEKISLKDCRLVSDYINQHIDTIDPIKENYFLEVSSPGIERPLKKERDFEKATGQVVQAKLFSPLDGRKIIDGILKSFDVDNVAIELASEELIVIPRDKISLIKPVIQL